MNGAEIYLCPDSSFLYAQDDDDAEVMPAVALLVYGPMYALTVSHRELLSGRSVLMYLPLGNASH